MAAARVCASINSICFARVGVSINPIMRVYSGSDNSVLCACMWFDIFGFIWLLRPGISLNIPPFDDPGRYKGSCAYLNWYRPRLWSRATLIVIRTVNLQETYKGSREFFGKWTGCIIRLLRITLIMLNNIKTLQPYNHKHYKEYDTKKIINFMQKWA